MRVSARVAESTFVRENGSRRFREIEAFLPRRAVEPRLLSSVVEFFDKAWTPFLSAKPSH